MYLLVFCKLVTEDTKMQEELRLECCQSVITEALTYDFSLAAVHLLIYGCMDAERTQAR